MPSIKVNFSLFSALKQRLGMINGSFGQYILVYTTKVFFSDQRDDRRQFGRDFDGDFERNYESWLKTFLGCRIIVNSDQAILVMKSYWRESRRLTRRHEKLQIHLKDYVQPLFDQCKI
jgi:hypothetical protein